MKLFVALIICLISIETSQSDPNVNRNQWVCIEYGPVESEKPDGSQTEYYRHLVDYEKLKNFSDKNYTIEELGDRIDKKGSNYDEMPMICTYNDNNKIEVLNFTKHPHVYKAHYEGNQDDARKTVSVMYRMNCEVFKLIDHIHANNFTWEWYRTDSENKWVLLDKNDTNYEITYEYSTDKIINYNTILTIKSLNLLNEGRYKCSAFNDFGDNEHIFNLEILNFYVLVIPFIAVLVLVTLVSVAVFARERYVNRKEKRMEFMNSEKFGGHSVNA